MKYLFFVLPIVALVYVFIRMWHILPFSLLGKSIAVTIGVLIFVTMVWGIVLGFEKMSINFSAVVYEITTSWLFILLYLLMIFLLMDVLRCCHILPKDFLFNSIKGSLIVFTIIVALFVYGNVHYHHKKAVRLNLTTDKQIEKPLKIILISDLHLGYHNQINSFAKWVDMINKEQADLILIAGDIIDRSIRPLFEQKVYNEFHRLNAPIYACFGNHEYFAGKQDALAFYEKAGINVLQDTSVVYNNIVIAGRDDRINTKRKELKQILKDTDKNKYHILLDHQPYNLEQAQKEGVDFQFSGHTHYGQVFPINLITDAIYEKAYGCYKKGQTDYYISSGLGIWGGKFRIGTKSEYVVLTLRQK